MIRIGFRSAFSTLCLFLLTSPLQGEWISQPVSPDSLLPNAAWETDYQERISEMVGAENWSVSSGNADTDEGKRTWSPLLAHMWEDRDDAANLNSWISGKGNDLLNSQWAGSFYKAFTSPGYSGYYFRFKNYSPQVSLPAGQVTTAQAAVGTDATGDPYSQSLDKGWAYFARPDHHMDPIFTFTEFNSENFHWMHRLAALQWAYELPDLNLGTTHYDTAIPSSRTWAQGWTNNWVRSLFAAGRVEWNSNNYWSYTFAPVSTLYDLPPGHLPVPGMTEAEASDLRNRVKLQARAAADWMVLENALHYVDGFRGGPDTRAKSDVQNAFAGETWAWMYAQFGSDEGAAEHPTFSRNDVLSRVPKNQIGFIAWAEYRPLQVILDIAHRRFALPVEIQSAKPHTSFDETDYSNWKGDVTWNNHPSMQAYASRFEFETLYLDENGLMASAATFRPDGDAAMTSQQNFFSEQNLWRIMAKGSSAGAVQVTGTTLADPGYYKLAGRDPWENIGQHGNVMIQALKRSDSDNGHFMVIPKSATVQTQGNNLFCDLGHGVYFAVLPRSSGSITFSNSSYSGSHQRYQWQYTSSTLGALVIELGVARDHSSFANFVAAVSADLSTRLTLPEANEIQYESTGGDLTRLQWQAPWTGLSGQPSYTLSDGTVWGDNNGEAAGVVPRLWRNGTEVNFAAWEAYEVVQGEPIVHQEWGGNALRMSANGATVTIEVDPATAEVSYLSLQEVSAAEAWRHQYFGSTEDQGDAADTMDYDEDGQANLLERAFATSPVEESDYFQPFVSFQTVEDQLLPTFTYRSRMDEDPPVASGNEVEGLTYTVEHKQDLNEEWQTTGIQLVSALDVTDNPLVKDITVRPDGSSGSSSMHFFRLVIDQE